MKSAMSILNIGSLFVMAVVASSLMPAGQAHAYACKASQHQGAVVKPKLFGAKIAARKDWESRMKTKYGLSWSTWEIAANKSIECHKSGGKNLCIASAKPCNYVTH